MKFFENKVVSIAEIIPFAMNSRTHSDEQVGQIAASIREFGFTNPILIDEENNVIAGHGRILAARKLGLDEVPAVCVTGLDERKRRALVIADNKLALNAGWDDEILQNELKDLAEDYGGLIGFASEELEKILNMAIPSVQEGETNPFEEWEGMPEFEQDNKNSFRHIIVHFESQYSVDEFSKLIGQNLTDKTKSIWHPKQIRMDTESKRYGNDSE